MDPLLILKFAAKRRPSNKETRTSDKIKERSYEENTCARACMLIIMIKTLQENSILNIENIIIEKKKKTTKPVKLIFMNKNNLCRS